MLSLVELKTDVPNIPQQMSGGSRILGHTCLAPMRMFFLLYYEGPISRGLRKNCSDKLYNESDEGINYLIILGATDTILIGSLLLDLW